MRRLARSCFWDASRAHCEFEATSEMAIELPPEEQVKGEDLIGELLKSLYGSRRAAHKWKKKRQRSSTVVFVIGTWSPAILCSQERELCGFVHGDDFIIAGDSVTLAWIESRINKGVILMRRAIPGRDDGDDKTVTIFNRFVS